MLIGSFGNVKSQMMDFGLMAEARPLDHKETLSNEKTRTSSDETPNLNGSSDTYKLQAVINHLVPVISKRRLNSGFSGVYLRS